MIKDLLYVKGSVFGISVHKVVVYFAMNDKQRNNRMKKKLKKNIEENNEENLVILGDFDGHVSYKGAQK